VVRWDRIEYRREIRHLDEVTVQLWLAAASDDLSRFRFANPILHAGEPAAVVTTEAGWLDLAERRLVAPPPELRAAIDRLPRTEGFEPLASSLRSSGGS
jgi:acyl-CoA thioester hydrolase